MSRTELLEPEEDEDTDDEKPVLVSDFISPWNLALPNMSFGRHSHGIAAIGNQFSVFPFLLTLHRYIHANKKDH